MTCQIGIVAKSDSVCFCFEPGAGNVTHHLLHVDALIKIPNLHPDLSACVAFGKCSLSPEPRLVRV